MHQRGSPEIVFAFSTGCGNVIEIIILAGFTRKPSVRKKLNSSQPHTDNAQTQKWFSLQRLSVQISLIAVGIPTIILSLFAVYHINAQSNALAEQLDASLKNEAVQLSASVSTALFNFDDETLHVICKAALQKPEIIKITLWDRDREYLSIQDTGRTPAGEGKGEIKQVEYPILYGSELLGRLEIMATREFLKEKIHTLKISNLVQVVMLDMILGLILILVLNARFVKPLKDLKQSSEKIASGNLNTPINVHRPDEIGMLANNLLSMRDSVKEKVKSLQAESDRHQETSLALEKSESFLRRIIDLIPHMIFVKNRSGRFLVVNKAVAKEMHSTVEHLTGRLHQETTRDTATAERLLADDRRVIESGKTLSLISEIHGGRLGKGESRWFSTKKIPFQAPDGEDCVIGITIDISEIKQAEDQLRKNNLYIDNIINSMPSALFSLDRDCHITKWNHKAEEYYLISSEAAVARPLTEIVPAMQPLMEKIHQSMKESMPYFSPRREQQGIHGTIYEEITIYPLTSDKMEGVVIRVDDVTESVRMEEMMVQSEKMLSIGGLAAGMAHEINNPLAGMMQNAQVVLNRITGNLPASIAAAKEAGITMDQIIGFMKKRGLLKQLELIHEAGKRASQIVQNMLSFSRKDASGKILQDIPELLENTLEVARSDYNLKKQYDFKKIAIRREYQPDLPEVMCEISKIQQVFFNILKNAAEAMHDFPQDAAPEFIFRIFKTGDDVVIEIEDNGPGMDEKIRRRLFEPFFTTKPVGKGTGLGLSVSYFIITENHGGKLQVISEPGQGTCFIIRLPIAGS